MAGGGTGKKKIEIKKIEKRSDRMVTFSKRRKGLFSKATQLHSTTAAQFALCVFSPGGRPYVHAVPSFDQVINRIPAAAAAAGGAVEENMAAAAAHVSCKSWLESVGVEECDSLEEVLGLQKELELISDKVYRRIFVASDRSSAPCLL